MGAIQSKVPRLFEAHKLGRPKFNQGNPDTERPPRHKLARSRLLPADLSGPLDADTTNKDGL